MTDTQIIMLEAVARVIERNDELAVDWLLEGGICALEGPALLVTPSNTQLDDDWYAGEFVAHEAYQASEARRIAAEERVAELERQLASTKLSSNALAERARQLISKASFSAGGDRFSALRCVDLLDEQSTRLKEGTVEAKRIMSALFQNESLQIDPVLRAHYTQLLIFI